MPEPCQHASLYSKGTIIDWLDGNKYVAIYNDSKCKMEWQEFSEVMLDGYRALTIDYLRKNIGKEIVISFKSL